MTRHLEEYSADTGDFAAESLRTQTRRLIAEERRDGGQVAPLSSAQHRLWLLAELDPLDSAYVEVVTVRLTGTYDVARLRVAFAELVARHASLRTAIAVGHRGPVQVVAPPEGTLLDVVPGQVDEIGNDALLAKLTDIGLLAPFDLADGPLWRAQLRTISPTDAVLVLVIHHVVWDGTSAQVLLDELTALYDFIEDWGDAPPPSPVDYPEYARTERAGLDDDAHSHSLAYWAKRLSGVPGPLWPETPAAQERATGVVERRIRPELVRELRELTETVNCTPFMVALACVAIAARPYAAQDEIALGVPVSVRPPNAAQVIGHFLNLLPVRIDLPRAASRRSFVESVRDRWVELTAHHHVPFDRIVEELTSAGSRGNAPYAQLMFQYNRLPRPVLTADGVRWDLDWLPGRKPKCDVLVAWNETSEGVTTRIEYDAGRVSTEAATRLADGIQDMVSALTLDLDASVQTLPGFPAPDAPSLPLRP
ncbi:MAG: condensation domain-containing protein [Thermocrispum sp.]